MVELQPYEVGDEIGKRLIELRRQIDVLELEFARLNCEFEDSTFYEDEGFTSPVNWIRINCHMQDRAAGDRMSVGRSLKRLQSRTRPCCRASSALPTSLFWHGRQRLCPPGSTNQTCLTRQRRARRASSSTCASTIAMPKTLRVSRRPARFAAGHHLVHWAKGGTTDLDNQVLLCHRHHWMVHEGGWQLIRGEDQALLTVPPPTRFRPFFRGPDSAARRAPASSPSARESPGLRRR